MKALSLTDDDLEALAMAAEGRRMDHERAGWPFERWDHLARRLRASVSDPGDATTAEGRVCHGVGVVVLAMPARDLRYMTPAEARQIASALLAQADAAERAVREGGHLT